MKGGCSLMASNTKNIIRDVAGAPIPQYYNPFTDAFEALMGNGGATRTILYDADGNPVNIVELLTSIINELQKPVQVEVSNEVSNMEYYGKSTDAKPNITEVPVGAVFYEIDTETAYMNDGTSWVEV